MSTYLEALAEIGVSEEVYRQCSEKNDLVLMPALWRDRIEVRESGIEGMGVFARQPFEAGEVIAPLFMFCGTVPLRTNSLGRYVNHGESINTKPDVWDGMVVLRAVRYITIGEELTVDYSAVHGCLVFAFNELRQIEMNRLQCQPA